MLEESRRVKIGFIAGLKSLGGERNKKNRGRGPVVAKKYTG